MQRERERGEEGERERERRRESKDQLLLSLSFCEFLLYNTTVYPSLSLCVCDAISIRNRLKITKGGERKRGTYGFCLLLSLFRFVSGDSANASLLIILGTKRRPLLTPRGLHRAIPRPHRQETEAGDGGETVREIGRE